MFLGNSSDKSLMLTSYAKIFLKALIFIPLESLFNQSITKELSFLQCH